MTAQFIRPATLDHALDLLNQHGEEAKIIAGGTAVVLLLQQKLIAPQLLVDLSRIPALSEIQNGSDGLRVGPLVSLAELARSPQVLSAYPGLAHSAASVGNVRIRNQATLGGNLAEADYASDPPTSLSVIQAVLEVSSAAGTRRVGMPDFLLGMYTTSLQPNEIITGIHLPAPPPGGKMSYHKFRTRSSEDRPCLGVAVSLRLDSDRVVDLRVAVGAATEIPVRLPDVEMAAADHQLTDDLIGEIAHSYSAEIDTLDDLRGSSWYRKRMIEVYVRRALTELRDGSR